MLTNVQTSSQPIYPPPEQHQPHVDPKVDSFPYSPIIYSPFPSFLSGEGIDYNI